MYRILIFISIGILLFSYQVKPVLAGITCTSQYGTTADCAQTSDFTLDLAVQNLKTNTYVDNLELHQGTYQYGQTFAFRVFMKNSTNNKIGPIETQVFFPEHATFVKGEGKFDANTKTFTAQNNLEPGASKNLFIIGKIIPGKNGTEGVICETTQAISTYLDKQARDVAQFCISSQVLPAYTGAASVAAVPNVKATPGTGPETLAYGLIPLTAFAGYYLRKKSSAK